MKFINLTILSISLVLALTACGEKTKTEEWYISHPEELNKEVEKCKAKSLNEMLKDKHCQVVNKAHKTVHPQHEENLPPIKLKF